MEFQALTEYEETVIIVGFFDLMGYAKWCEERPPREVLELARELFTRTGKVIAKADGRVIKAIGDAGLFVFPAEDLDRAVLALLDMKRTTDAWLAESSYPDVMSVKVQWGPVAFGRVGPPDDERLDVYGKTVNHAAMMKGRPFTVAAALAEQLGPETGQLFKRFNDDEFVTVG